MVVCADITLFLLLRFYTIIQKLAFLPRIVLGSKRVLLFHTNFRIAFIAMSKES